VRHLSVLLSGHQTVRFGVCDPGFPGRVGVADHGLFDEHPWPCSPGRMRRREMVNPPIIEATPKPGKLTIMVVPVNAKMCDLAM